MTPNLLRPRQLLRGVMRRFRPPPPSDPWRKSFEEGVPKFRRFLERCDIPEGPRSGPAAAILLTPWGWGQVPWYGIAMAIALLQRGRRAVLFWDDTDLLDRDTMFVQNRTIGEMLQLLPPHLEVVRLSQLAPTPSQPGDVAALERLVRMNEVWRTRAGTPEAHDLEISRKLAATCEQTLSHARTAFAQGNYAYFVVIGGIVWSSGALLLAAAQAGVRHVTYDANVGVAQFANRGIAAQQSDLDVAYRELLTEPPATRQWMVQQAQSAFQERVQGKDLASYQFAAPSAAILKVAGDVVIPMNIEWDSAALEGHHLFASSVDWIVQTIRYILEHSEKTVAVRQHPAERRPLERSKLDIIAILRAEFGTHPRLHVVLAEDDVNTYDLIQPASLVIPFVSTIGIETAAMGKPTLQGGTSYYSHLGFVWWAETRQEYFDLLGRGLRGELPLLPDQVERAWLCYYLTPVANRIWTAFTPQPSDFERWVLEDPAELFATPEVGDILDSMEQDTPVALLRHRRLKAGAGL